MTTLTGSKPDKLPFSAVNYNRHCFLALLQAQFEKYIETHALDGKPLRSHWPHRPIHTNASIRSARSRIHQTPTSAAFKMWGMTMRSTWVKSRLIPTLTTQNARPIIRLQQKAGIIWLSFVGGDVASSPLLATKLYIPHPRPDLVARIRLTERLSEALGTQCRLTLISAPPGFGKTTLLSEWISRVACPAAWVSLDEGDNDPVRFWAYIIAALKLILPDVGDHALALLQSPQQSPIESVLIVLINEIASVPNTFVLVLDDYHVIETLSIHNALAFLLDHLPPQMRLIIAGRADPPLPLARLRARGQLIELHAVDLRFTPEETATFLNQVMGLNLSTRDIAALEAHTEGWIAGLQLAALSMQGREDIASFIAAFTGSNRYIFDYLVEEVLRNQPADVQTFLLQTCLLDRLCGPLCDAVTGRVGSQAMLTVLEQANLFTIPLDEERRWYRYHHLFADFLQSRLNETQPEVTPSLHRRAADWYEQNGLPAEAVIHALAAQDIERAARLIEQAADIMLRHGEVATLLSWLDALPEQLVHSRPQLCLHRAWALVSTGQLNTVESLLQDAERGLQTCPPTDEIAIMRNEATVIRAVAAFAQQDMPRAIELGRQALKLMPTDGLSIFRRSLTVMILGSAYRLSGNVTAAKQTLADAIAISQTGSAALIAIASICNLAMLEMMQGHLHQAAETFQQALKLATQYSAQSLPTVGMAYVGMGDLLREWNDLDGATRQLVDGIELLGKQWDIGSLFADGYIPLARVKQAQGDAAGVLDVLQKAEQLARKLNWTLLVEQVAAYRARAQVLQGDVEAATLWAQGRGLGIEDELSYLHEAEYLTWVRVLITQNKPLEATRLLSRLLRAAESGGRTNSVIEIMALEALAHRACGDTAQALAVLERALTLAEPEGYVRVFVDEGEPMRLLLQRIKAEDGTLRVKEYFGHLLAAFEKRPTSADLHPSALTLQPLVEPLTEREIELLPLIASGLSNQEIAEKLYVTVGTAKTHLRNIYRKLGVKSRTQALARAKEMGLL
jgi:LuxR family maltose regulon positive regulatory protein